MKNLNENHPIAGLLVRWRKGFLAGMATLAVFCMFLIPRVRLNSDMTSNLPDDSQMRQGISILEKDFPLMDIRMQTLRVLFYAEPPADSLRDAIAAIPDVMRYMGTEQQGEKTLYQFTLPQHAKGQKVVEAVKERFGDRVIAEVDDNSHMPENLALMLLTGVVIALVILFLMCPSFVETLLFLLAINFAISINMGTNALLPSVYLVTHTLVAVLQMALSMDFAIILMNRYRQEKRPDRTNEEAMTAAIAGAAPSILSSGLTTISSLMMLCFMRLQIGADLGIVLSKGVFCSLLATFLALPALILRFDKAIVRTEKKVLRLPTDGLARFEMRHRIPLAILFLAIFIGSWLLQKRTEISYSVFFPTTITEQFPPKNAMLILYPTEEEEKFIPIADRISAEPDVLMCISYPSLTLKPRTASEFLELATLAPEMKEAIPEGALDLIYYAASHPERTERMRMDQLEPTARELISLAKQFLPDSMLQGLSARFNVDAMMQQLAAKFLSENEPEPEEMQPETMQPETMQPTEPVQETEPEMPEEPVAPEEPAENSLPAQDTVPATPAAPADSQHLSVLDTVNAHAFDDYIAFDMSDTLALQDRFSYENILLPRTADEMAKYLTLEKKNVTLIYRMAGAGRKGRPSTMTAYEVLQTLNDKILGNRLYASMVSSDQKKLIRTAWSVFQEILAEGPKPKPEAPADTLATPIDIPVDTVALAELLPQPDSVLVVATPDTVVVTPAPKPQEPTPFERLADMAFSGRSYTSAQIYRALNRAGIAVSQEELDVLFLYHGYQTNRDTTTRLNLLELTEFLGTLPQNPILEQYLQPETKQQLDSLDQYLDEQVSALRGKTWSLAAVMSEMPDEGDHTFAFIDTVMTLCQEQFTGDNYYVGYSVMYKEMKEGFPRELLLLTLLTVAAIFLIVALTFRSLVVPFLLIPTVLSAVWLNVFASGLGGHTMLYVSYLIVQSILMGATIDYSILFTQYYRDARKTLDKAESLKSTYYKSFHAILTSGLILVLTPLLMAYSMKDPMIVAILRCISLGAAAAILLIFFVLPATLVIMDKWILRKK